MDKKSTEVVVEITDPEGHTESLEDKEIAIKMLEDEEITIKTLGPHGVVENKMGKRRWEGSAKPFDPSNNPEGLEIIKVVGPDESITDYLLDMNEWERLAPPSKALKMPSDEAQPDNDYLHLKWAPKPSPSQLEPELSATKVLEVDKDKTK